jgi:hypothetical protein
MSEIWTHGRWQVTEGLEEEFLDGFSALVREVEAELRLPPPILLRHREVPSLFVSMASWDDEHDIQRLRAFLSPRVASLRGLERFEPATLDRVELHD